MAILIDPPFWPAHGTIFSHLISDASLEELHAFARAAELPEGAFDRDHYDVPERRYADLVARGAVPVQANELVRRLLRSGLRVPARQRPEKLDGILAAAWERLAPGQGAIGAELIERWSEPHRHYHDRTHLLAVIQALNLLALRHGEDPGDEPRVPWLAAWFHDAVYRGQAGRDEEESAGLASRLLSGAGFRPAEVDGTVRLVLLTAGHAPGPHDPAGRLLCDADLEVLGRSPADYLRYAQAVRRDYAHVPDPAFAAGRAAVLRALLDLDPLYGTGTARRLWQERARENLAGELESLGGR
ncbi:hypothetical protein NCCP1664_24380 [Zafaria cholistanensis]|uniref:DUF4031 domain-containing protein n=1 Tax=Zafaria cholistanensis TaxID=1682741 RepID=A0A5A7NT34_9MICC|nr:DUF4031 domain-containing protein [Zafaria cholistanensis]GER23943.1 hypothetical protein NCCP1664_24380 [Zafaria cholistanensis]